MARSYATLLLIMFTAGGLVLSLRFTLPYFSPFLVALLLAALIDAPVNRLEKWGIKRSFAVVLVLFAIALATLGGLFMLSVKLAQDLLRLADHLPYYSLRVQEITTQFITWADVMSAGLPAPVADVLRGATSRMTIALEAVIRSFVASLAALPNLAATLAVVCLAAFFFARDGHKLARYFVQNLPPGWRVRTRNINREIFAGVVGFVRAQALLMSLSGALTTLVFTLFGVSYAWLLGVLAGVLDMLPMIGLSGVFVPVIVGQWLMGNTAVSAGLGAAWGAVILIRQACEPAVVGSQVGLHPLTSLAAMYIGVQAWGLAGVFLGPIIATSAKVLWLGALRPMLLHPE